MSMYEEVKIVRSTLGWGLREAYDAVEKYGDAQKALAALAPETKTKAKNDPYANAVEARERWENKARHYRSALQRIVNLGRKDDDVYILAVEGLHAGDSE